MLKVADVAKTCHEVNKVYCESIGDFTQVHWSKAPQWQKNSAIDGVRYLINNIDATPEDIHENWMKAKKADGWRFGIVKDGDAKTHPCLIPYNFLSAEQRMKDTLFISIVRSFFYESDRQEHNH
jgi:hypothetical protein